MTDRQLNDKRRSSAGRALCPDTTIVLLNNGMADCQAQSGALPNLAGGEEWIEDSREMFRPNTWTGILDCELKNTGFPHRANMQLAGQIGRMRRQRLSRILEDIEQHLFELMPIAQDWRQVRRDIEHNLDIARAQSLLDAIECLDNQRRERNRLGLRHLRAREAQ